MHLEENKKENILAARQNSNFLPISFDKVGGNFFNS